MHSGRTPLFKRLMRVLAQARFLANHPGGRSAFLDRLEASRQSSTDSPGTTRRRFLKESALAGAAIGLPGLLGARIRELEPGEKAPPPAGPVAIIGGGAAGLTAAYRLLQAGVPCEVFEASERWGGRIFTKTGFNKDGMFCELGAELVDSNHADLISLAGELGLEIEELKASDAGVDFYHFGGKLYTDRELIPLFEPVAERLKVDADGLETDEGEYTPKARKWDLVTLQGYLDSLKNAERWVVDLLRIAYTGEYGLEAFEQSSLNLLSYINPDTSSGFKLFGDSDESKRVQGGNSSIPDALFKAIRSKVPCHLEHRLVKISDAGGSLELTFQAEKKTRSLKFSRVICAIPFTILRKVEGVFDLDLTPSKKECIRNLGYGTNVKAIFGFSQRCWRSKPVQGQTSNGSIYCDLPAQCFWETSRAQKGNRGILTNFIGGKAGVEFHPNRFDRAMDELQRIIPDCRGSFDGTKTMMNWPDYQFTKGSYSCPKVGQVTTILESAAAAELGGRLVFAGEHTSADFGGFMNGAIESGNRAAREIAGA